MSAKPVTGVHHMLFMSRTLATPVINIPEIHITIPRSVNTVSSRKRKEV